MKTIDVSIKDEYYSQLNNKYIPLSACTPTSLAMALIYEGVDVCEAGSKPCDIPFIAVPKTIGLDDYLTLMAWSKMGLALRKTLAPWAERQKIEPQTVHAVMEALVNNIVGIPVVKFHTKGTIEQLEAEIKGGHPCVVSGSFTSAGHSVVLAGMRWTESGKPVMIMIDDPYGEYPKYENHNGNNVWMPLETFRSIWSGFFYTFRKYGS